MRVVSNLRFIISTVLLYTACSFGAYAATNQWYQIEVIVFENAKHTSEDLRNKDFLRINPQAIPANSQTETDYFHPLEKSEWSLNSIEEKLESKHRKILLHTAWVQNLTDKENSLPIRLQAGDSISTDVGNETELDGTLTVSLNRYLHVATDLQLLKHLSSGYKGYHLTASRRMRSSEVHYIDHPAIGIIVKITPHSST